MDKSVKYDKLLIHSNILRYYKSIKTANYTIDVSQFKNSMHEQNVQLGGFGIYAEGSVKTEFINIILNKFLIQIEIKISFKKI